MDTTLEALKARQTRIVRGLHRRLAKAVVTGNEYEAHLLRADIIAASSLARLVHVAPVSV